MRRRHRWYVFTVAAPLAACVQQEEPVRELALGPAGSQSAAAAASPVAPEGTTDRPPAGGEGVAGITWGVPAFYQSRGAAPLRVATYGVPPAPGDTEGGELAVFFFGEGQGGDVQGNLQRWYGQLEQPDGRPSAQAAKVAQKSVNGVRVTTVEVDGTYLWSPRPMASDKVKKPGYRLMGAIAEAPGGNVFFKLTAPQKTAAAAGFDSVVDSIRRL